MTDDDFERAAVSWLTTRGYTVTKRGTDLLNDLEASVGAVKASRTEAPTVFDEFWALYPRKVGKAAARKAFIKAWDPRVVVNGLKAWLSVDAFNSDPNYILHASTWLNQKCYNDIPMPYKGIQKPTQGPSRTRKALDDWLNDGV